MTIKLDVSEILSFAERLGELKGDFLDLMVKGVVDNCNELLEIVQEDLHEEEK